MQVINRQEILDSQFHWIGQVTRTASKADVSINRVFWDKQNSADMAYHFVLRNKAASIGDFVQIAIYKNRVLLRPGDQGLRLQSRKDNPNRYIKVKETKETEALKAFIGNYDIQFDEFYGLYYIEKEVKE